MSSSQKQYEDRLTYIIYHQVKPGTDCPDGIMAAAIASMKYPEATIMGDSYQDNDWYQENDPHFYENKNLIIVDFSYPASWLKHWESHGCTITLIDHHAPKFPMLSGFSGAILDANECGATLTWKTFFPNDPMPELLLHVRRRDIGADGYYNGECRDSEAINEALTHLRHSWSTQDKDTISALKEVLKADNCSQLLLVGQDILVERDRIIKNACKRCRLVKLGDYTVPYLVTTSKEDRHVSNIGNYMCRVLYPESPFAWVKTEDGKSSLRSTGFDVSVIANQYGGGGHACASGFSRNVEPLEE
jgi:oligoribonuclease NrnB/cAMP/cGMP phosphodiesterase (DHH superfamily)